MYAPQGQFMNIDDNLLIYNNLKVQDLNLENIKEIFTTYDPELYIPLTLLSYQLEYHFAGENPSVFHVTNLIVHILNALLVLVLFRFFSKTWYVPFLTAILFAIHPINTEAVMWISGRKDLLSAFFFLGSLVLYCRYITCGSRKAYYGSLGAFVFALMSKITAVTLPLVALIIDDLHPTNIGKNHRRNLQMYCIPAILFLAIGMMGKSLGVFVLGYFEAFLMACKGVYFYFGKVILPTNLSMSYEQLSPINILKEDFLIPVLILIIIAVITLSSRAFSKVFSFGMLWFGITLLPNIGNSVKGVEKTLYFASDRYIYIPSIGLFFIVASGIAWALHKSSHQQKWLLSFVTVIILGAYGITAQSYSVLWLTPKQYHERIVRLYPESILPRVLIGMSYIREENNEDAIEHFQKATERKPKYANPVAHLGLALVKTGEVDLGIEKLEQALELNDKHAYSYIYLSYAYMLKNNDAKARELLTKALEKNSKNAKVHQMYGTLEHRSGNVEAAEDHLRKSIQIDNTSAQAKSALARLLRGE